MLGSLPHPIKWNPLAPFYHFSPLPHSPVASPPLPTILLFLPCHRPPPAASPSSPERRPVAPSPPAASQPPPLPRAILRLARRAPETRSRRCSVASPPLHRLRPAPVRRRYADRRRRLLLRYRGIVSFPGHSSVSPEHRRAAPASPSASPEFPRSALSPPVRRRPRHHRRRHRSGKVALGLASPPPEPRRCSSSSSPSDVAIPSSGRPFLLTGSSSRGAASVVGFAAACSAPSSPPCSCCQLPRRLLTGPGRRRRRPLVVPGFTRRGVRPSVKPFSFVVLAPSSAVAPSSSSTSPPRRQALRRSRLAFVQRSPPKSLPRRLSHPDFCFRIYKLFNKLLLEFILNVH
ncbi:serine/arginine-rich splicing factor SR45-like [Oryza sativa Japonica Group]|uniref:serine/arginine-rich splicing factor SR45-like n=1 Tax=Oryza sativa subsp. japonica TaxID=39947 RepID=UPI00339D2A8F